MMKVSQTKWRNPTVKFRNKGKGTMKSDQIIALMSIYHSRVFRNGSVPST